MYIIGKDGLWLMNYRESGCKELSSEGRLEIVYTCLWGERKADAKVFEKDYEAKYLAKKVGAEAVFVSEKGRKNE